MSVKLEGPMYTMFMKQSSTLFEEMGFTANLHQQMGFIIWNDLSDDEKIKKRIVT